VMVPAGKTPAFVVVEPQLVFEILIGALDAPALHHPAHQLLLRQSPRSEQRKQFAGSSSSSRHSISSHTVSRLSMPCAPSYAGTTRRSANRADRSCLAP
jgi:hypothetical protein